MNITPSLEFFLLLAAVVTAIAAGARWAFPKYRRARQNVIAAKDSILGREAQVDSITGREIAPALPGIGQRMDSFETALTQLVDLHKRMDSHEDRIDALEKKEIERILARTESIEMLRTIDTALQSEPRRESE